MNTKLKIGTRESQLAVWQADLVKSLLLNNGTEAELVFIKSDGDVDLKTPLYEMGVQGVFTRSLDVALLNGQIDIAVHSMKDVPTQLAAGISQAAVLERASPLDLLVYKDEPNFLHDVNSIAVIATSSIRRKAQWLHRFPGHEIVNLRGNVNTRLRKLAESEWQGAVFAAAGLERIGLRPENSLSLDWMLPAPAQGAIMVVCRTDDAISMDHCKPLNHEQTAICVKVERDFLRGLLGGCSTPISAYATIVGEQLHFRGNIVSPDGKHKKELESITALSESPGLGERLALKLLSEGGQAIADSIRNVSK